VKVAVTLDERFVRELDRWVRERKYPSRSGAIQAAVDARSQRQRRLRIAREAAKIDPAEEQAMADEFRLEPWP
jgi:Arc/MetJ-type ribon-helix-helix transcriptional regulator